MKTFKEYSDKIEFDYDDREFEVLLNSNVTVTNSVRLGILLGSLKDDVSKSLLSRIV